MAIDTDEAARRVLNKQDADGDQIELWTAAISVGGPLPLMPLPLDKGLFVPLDLDSTYHEACRRSRLA